MPDICETVKENLVRLRHEHKLTQLELAQRINYSDKAVSRWENGDVTPDVATLAALADLYGVPITTFFLPAGAQLSKEERRALKKAQEEAEKEEKRKKREEEKRKRREAREAQRANGKQKNSSGSRRTAVLVCALCFLWAVILTLFFLLNGAVSGAWRVFIWGVPLTVLVLFLYFRPSRHSAVRTVFASLLLWTVLVSVYLQLARWSLFPILFAGIPLEAVIILFPFFRKAKDETK